MSKKTYDDFKKSKESATKNKTNGRNSREPGSPCLTWDTSKMDVVGLFEFKGHYGRPLKENKHAVLCLWQSQHSDDRGAEDSDTVVFDGTDGRPPAYNCQHKHCDDKNLQDVCNAWPEEAERFGAVRVPTGADGRRFALTDVGNAERLLSRYGGNLLHCVGIGWLWWDGKRWVPQADKKVMDASKKTVKAIYAEQKNVTDAKKLKDINKHAALSQRRERLAAMIYLASHDLEIDVAADQLDSDHLLLNCPNGTLDLRMGELRDHRRADHLTRICPVEFHEDATCDRFDKFLLEVFAGDEKLVAFIWRAIGYSLTGSVREQTLFFLYGSGSNGKSTFLEILRALLGDYGGTAAPGLLMESKGERHPTELADLRGKRFVSCFETGEGKRLAEDLVKWITGTDRLKGRFMRQDFFEFDPTHKLWLSANHRPVIQGTDHAIWRRIPLIPFSVTFVDEDKAKEGQKIKNAKLLPLLMQELPGILVRAVKGAQDWDANGLQLPASVRAASNEYRQEMDSIGRFLEECCAFGEKLFVSSSKLFGMYKAWCRLNGEDERVGKAFGTALRERGFTNVRSNGSWWHGLEVTMQSEIDYGGYRANSNRNSTA